MYKLSQPRANTDISWGKGLWLGRSTLNNEIIVSTATGEVITVRTIRRLPPEEQHNKELLAALKGTPWSPKGTTEVENTLPQLALEQFRFSAGKGGPLMGEAEKGTTTDGQQPQRDATTTVQGGASSSGNTLKRTPTGGQQEQHVRRRIMGKTTDILNWIPPPPGLPPPTARRMQVDPPERTLQDTEMEDPEEEGDHKRMKVLSINHVGVLKKVKLGKNERRMRRLRFF
jgi:hypothetical protein